MLGVWLAESLDWDLQRRHNNTKGDRVRLGIWFIWYRVCPAYTKPGAQIPATRKLDVRMAHTCNPSNWEAEEGDSEV